MDQRATTRLRTHAARFVAASLLATVFPTTGPTPRPAHAALAPVSTVIIDGRGFGHGIGMSQWGAYGWATQHGRTWEQILAFYYGGTTLTAVRDTDFTASAPGRMTVHLTDHDNRQTAVVSDSGVLGTPVDLEARQWSTMVAREVPGTTNRYDVWGHANRTCPSATDLLVDTQGWVLVASNHPGPIDFLTPSGDDPGAVAPRDLVGVCEPDGGIRYYRGIIRAANQSTGGDRTVNDVALESYVKGVVPREVSGSWGDAAGGAGMHALRAQAVAARSYALAGTARSTVAKTCDTTSCQVYSGAAYRSAIGSASTILEDPRSNRAVDDTAGMVMRTSAGKVANTMFSASNGGRSVSAGLFPAVDDVGDAVPNNPNHTWSVTVAASRIMSSFPTIGKLLDIEVTQRSGGGPWGGWVDKLVLKGSTTSLTITGDELRRALGLKSRYVAFTLVRANAGAKAGPGLYIGGSVGASVKSTLTRLLSDGYTVMYSAKSSRCTLPRNGSCTTNNALSVINSTAPVPAFVIMQMGYNDNPATFADTIDAAMAAITARGTTRVFWLTLSERRPDGKGGSAFAPANAALRDATARWPQIVIMDWNAASSGAEADAWFVKGTAAKPDLVHLTSVGRSRFSLFVRSQLDQFNAMGLVPNGSPSPGEPGGRPILSRGSVGSYVVELQQALSARGYTLSDDGEFGPLTETKVKEFQAANGLPADGIVGIATWSALGLGPPTTTTTTTAPTTVAPTTPVARPTLRRGSKGPYVVELQQALIARGYDLVADGMFGSRTRAAVISFQKKAKLPTSGVVGVRTWKALGW